MWFLDVIGMQTFRGTHGIGYPSSANFERSKVRAQYPTRACCSMIAVTIIVHSCWPQFRVAAKKRFHHHNRDACKRFRFESHTGQNQETCLNQKRLHY